MSAVVNTTQENNKRIAKNTIFLYFRTLLVMCISLYTSRVILNQLGVENYGIYNIVGGVVTMFSVISSALSTSISRFITVELGRGNTQKTQIVFSASINIQICLSLLILLLGEILGVYFLNYKMSIPAGRLYAANWVLQFSLIAFCINIISIPYNALIIAKEKMSVFAYISVLEALLKLGICYVLIISPWDKLITYSSLMVIVAIIIRFTYSIYCNISFEESHYKWTTDKSVFSEMSKFAGLTFFNNAASILNNQGVSLLVNLFFGVVLNAARGIAIQVESAVMQFVNNFTTALNPQITKNYAMGNYTEMYKLICRGSKFSFFLLLLLAAPIEIETEYILRLWLKIVPDHTVWFVRLSIIGSMANIIGNTGYTACMATGNIKRYVVWITSVGMLIFPLTWISYELGMPAESAYVLFILVYIGVNITRLWIMKGLLNFPVQMFVKDVIVPITTVSIVGLIIPLIVASNLESSFWRLLIIGFLCVSSIGTSIICIGLTKHEREMTIGKVISKIKKV